MEVLNCQWQQDETGFEMNINESQKNIQIPPWCFFNIDTANKHIVAACPRLRFLPSCCAIATKAAVQDHQTWGFEGVSPVVFGTIRYYRSFEKNGLGHVVSSPQQKTKAWNIIFISTEKKYLGQHETHIWLSVGATGITSQLQMCRRTTHPMRQFVGPAWVL